MEQRTLIDMNVSKGTNENNRRLPRLLRLDDVVLTQMLLSRKPILAVSKLILKPASSSADPAPLTAEGEECFVFHANWQGVC
jgi:hypothetical protein